MKKIILLIILFLLIILLASACEFKDHDGEVVDKVSEKQPDTYMNMGNGVSVPVIGPTNYYVVVENEDGERERVGVKTKVYDQFNKGDEFSNNNSKVYRNGELIDE